MFTFRAHQTEPLHSHRLLYLHASERDHQEVKSVRRFKTESDELISSQQKFLSKQTSGSRSSLNKTFSSSKHKIQYFDLDLRSLAQSIQSTDTNYASAIKEEKPVTKEVTNWSTEQKALKQDSSEIINLSNISNMRRINDSNKYSLSAHRYENFKQRQIKNAAQINMVELLEKQNFEELWQHIPFRQNKRVKQLQNNFKKDINIKYNKLKQKSTKPTNSTIVRSKHLTKTNAIQQAKEELQVKRIEKILADSKGNEYRVTIEKV